MARDSFDMFLKRCVVSRHKGAIWTAENFDSINGIEMASFQMNGVRWFTTELGHAQRTVVFLFDENTSSMFHAEKKE